MITANTGTPGTGKSLFAVGETIVPALRERRLVVTNIPLIISKLSAFVGFDVSPFVIQYEEEELGHVPFSQLEDWTAHDSWRTEGGLGPVYVVDEVHDALGHLAGDQKGSDPICKWLAVHRHVGADIVLITQDPMEIPVAVRRRIEFIYDYRKLTALGFGGRYVKRTFLKKQRDPIDRKVGKYPSEWYGLYQSRRKGVAERVSAPRNVLLSGKMIFIVFAIAVLGFIVSNIGLNFPGTEREDQQNASAEPAHRTTAVDQERGSASLVPQSLQAEAASESPAIIELRERLERRRLEASIASYEGALVMDGGLLVPGTGESPAAVFREAPRPPAHFLDGSTVRIVGHAHIGGDHTYWLDVDRSGVVTNWNARDLRQHGFEVMAINGCSAWLRREGEAFRLSCDGPTSIGEKRQVARSPVLVTYNADGSIQEPVPAAEGR